jgi:hypothetical protein
MVILPVPVQTLYAELVEQLVALDARRSIGHAPGSFVTKKLKRGTYYYFQYSEPGGTTRQAYIGPKSPALDALVERYATEREALRGDRSSVESLCAALRAGGATTTDARSARVLGALAEAGVFKLGAAVVGTHAFVVLGNVLGVRWAGASSRTEDVDIAAERSLEVAVPELRADVPSVLDSLGMGFLPVPGFSARAPSTSFRVRGQPLRIDLVTPARGRATAPVAIPRLNAAAAPLHFLDYLLEDMQPAAVVDGGGVLVNVPHAARFAVHKLLVAQDRPLAFQAKSRKDVMQAAHVLRTLEELRPGDVALAVANAIDRGKGWRAALRRGTAMLERADADAASILTRVLPGAR